MQTSQDHKHYLAYFIFRKETIIVFARVFLNLLLALRNHSEQLGGLLQVLHHDVHVPVVFVALDVLHDIWVVKHGKNRYFFSGQLQHVWVKRTFDHDFDGVLERGVLARLEQIHCAERALT